MEKNHFKIILSTYLRIILSIPKAKDRCMGSTALRVATVFGIDDIKVNQIEINITTNNPGKNVQDFSQVPRVLMLVSDPIH